MLEEQTLPEYEQRTYHEVNIGDVYRDKYHIIAKLGYGAHSTVWLAKDKKYVILSALKDLTDRA